MNELLINLPVLIMLAVLVNYMVGAFFIVYHLAKFGLDIKTKVLTTVFLSGLAALLFLSFYFFFKIDWQEIYQYVDVSKF
ncbi:MAG: hypothetical protein HYS78_01285 [Parcubacteria group bacterium]|nr:hypothetical protein [Parcubacteria group bacterium]